MRHIQEGQVEEGYRLLKVCADDYLNPMAMVKVARINFHGSEALQRPGQPVDLHLAKDLETSYYYIILAFEVTRVLNEETGDKAILNHVVNSGLALYDTFGMNQMEEGFDSKSLSAAFADRWAAQLQQYQEMYL